MRGHNANELTTTAQIMDASRNVLTDGVPCGVEDLTGRRLEQAQHTMPETTHMILTRWPDTQSLKESGYLFCEDTLYVVDYFRDPRVPRARMWREVYCHAERTN